MANAQQQRIKEDVSVAKRNLFCEVTHSPFLGNLLRNMLSFAFSPCLPRCAENRRHAGSFMM